MINIEIKGSCVTREAFNYIDKISEENKKDFNVLNYIFQKNICVLGSNPILDIKNKTINNIKTSLYNSETVRDFVIKQVDISINKEYIKKEKFEDEGYFIMDFIDERMKCIKINDSYIEYRPQIYAELKKHKPSIVENNFELFKQFFDEFMKKVLEKYPIEKIILNKAYATLTSKTKNEIVSHTNTFKEYNDQKIKNSYSLKRGIDANKRLNRIYDYILERYPSIKVIELPIENYYSEIDHKFGRGYYHYNEQYYIDFLNSLIDIVDNNENLENKQVVKVKNEYYIRMIDEKIKLVDKMQEYFNYNIQEHNINIDELIINNNFDIKNKNILVASKNKKIVQQKIDKKETTYNILNDKNLSTKIILGDKEQIKSIETYHQNGKRDVLVNIDDNKIQSLFICNENGKTIESIGMGEYVNVGVPYERSIYNDLGKRIEYLRYYGTGVICSKTLYDEDGSYKKSLFYNQEGKIKMERFYHPNRKKKLDKYYKNGVLTKIEECFLSGAKKQVTVFDKEGNIIKKVSRKTEKDKLE